MSGYMSIVERCMRVIINNPGGVSWARLHERVDLLAKATKREKTQVFQHLKGKSNVWNNEADDMSETMFMLSAEAPQEAVTETSHTQVSTTANAKKERLKKFENIGSTKTIERQSHPVDIAINTDKTMKVQPYPSVAKVTRLQPGKKMNDVFAGHEELNEDEVMAEMAWHVYESGEHGMTLNSLRMSVPEYSDCDAGDRAYLVNTMRQRYGIGYYEKETIGDRIIKVLARRAGGLQYVDRPDWFIKMGRKAFSRNTEALREIKPQIAAFGSVSNNAMADALSKLNAVALFANNAGTENDEFDEDEDDIEVDAAEPNVVPLTEALPLAKPTRDFVKEWTNNRPDTPTVSVSAPAASPMMSVSVTKAEHVMEPYKIDEPVKAETPKPPVADILPENLQPMPGTGPVTEEEVFRTADTLRLIADQLEAQAQISEVVRAKKARFDHLLKQARESAVAVQQQLNAHNTILNDLEQAANELTSI